MKEERYKPLNIDFSISEDMQNAIDLFLKYINNKNESGLSEDCYRADIDVLLKDEYNKKKISIDEFNILRNYYVKGQIYGKDGCPWQ